MNLLSNEAILEGLTIFGYPWSVWVGIRLEKKERKAA